MTSKDAQSSEPPKATKLDEFPELKKWGVIYHAAARVGYTKAEIDELEVWEVACVLGAHLYQEDDKGRLPGRVVPQLGEAGTQIGSNIDWEWASGGAKPAAPVMATLGITPMTVQKDTPDEE